MKRFLKLYAIEQKVAFRSLDYLVFAVIMPIGILLLMSTIGGQIETNAGYTFLESAFASLIFVGICAVSLMGLPLTIADYRDKKFLKYFYVTPVSPLWMIGAIMLCQVVSSLLSALSISFVAIVILGYQFQGNLFLFIGTWFFTLISMMSIGLLVASLTKTVKTANALTSLIYFPMLLLCGTTIPFELFPPFLQKIATFLPLTQGIQLLKGASMNLSLFQYLYDIVFLVVITIICTLLSIKLLKWES